MADGVKLYCGYQLKLHADAFLDQDLRSARARSQKHRSHIQRRLQKLVLVQQELDAAAMQKAWFPDVEADVFISHSHQDEEMAIRLAAWLEQELGLTAFVDSDVWGHSVQLQNQLDDLYCWNVGSRTYNYSKRNSTTCHVNMLLSSALTKMLDRSKCVFFLNTPASVTARDTADDTKERTYSPWIFHEIAMTKLLRENPQVPARVVAMLKAASSVSDSRADSVSVAYQLDTSHLPELNLRALELWRRRSTGSGDRLLELYIHSS